MKTGATIAVDKVASRRTSLSGADRFVVPTGHSAPAAFLASHLYVAHGLRERLAWPLHRATGGRTLVRPLASGPRTDAAGAAVGDLFRMVPEVAGEPVSWIVDTDYAESARSRTVAFVLPKDHRTPTLVVKRARLAETGSGRSLAREAEMVDRLRRKLTPALAETLPRVVAYRAEDEWESLALTWLPGRSAYVEMQTRLVPGAASESHFRGAAGWLASFHESTADPGHPLQPAGPGGEAREALAASADRGDVEWLARLCDWCAAHPVLAVAAHGDFWARNVLVDRQGDVSGVVDWEQSARTASPFGDLFQFPLSYGLAYPWRRYRRESALEAFRRTFLAENRVSSAVRQYFKIYCRSRGIESATLGWWFRLFLRRRARADVSKGDLWIHFEEMLALASRSVFSG
jgi:aminoglycoside phosphotransferase (APT) family kinase protein